MTYIAKDNPQPSTAETLATLKQERISKPLRDNLAQQRAAKLAAAATPPIHPPGDARNTTGVYVPLIPQRRICVIDGKEFTPTVHNQLTCSLTCGRARKLITTKNGKRAHKKHTSHNPPGDARNTTGVYVPLKLQRRICDIDGKEFTPTTSNQVTCSLTCSSARHQIKATERRRAHKTPTSHNPPAAPTPWHTDPDTLDNIIYRALTAIDAVCAEYTRGNAICIWQELTCAINAALARLPSTLATPRTHANPTP